MLAKEKAMGSVGAVAKVDAKTEEKGSEKGPFLFSSMMLLATFIIIVTINSGLMYGVFNKTFEPMEWLASWYWAVPYILVLLILRFTVKKRNSSVYIYLAIMMVAVGFVLFMLLDISAISYVFIDSLLLGASGIMDLFWSSTVGEIFEYTANPVRVLSIGWSANVIGVLIGAIISNEIIAMQLSRTLVTVIALGVTCVSLVILPLLLGRLRVQLKLHLFVSSYQIGGKMEQNIFQKNMSEDLLTNREKEILPLVLQGMSNKSIAAELFVSENTVKTHVRNILSKYQVDNRTQLISKLLMERM
jgi:DNA-binding CsgD family transcriptional regulator